MHPSLVPSKHQHRLNIVRAIYVIMNFVTDIYRIKPGQFTFPLNTITNHPLFINWLLAIVQT